MTAEQPRRRLSPAERRAAILTAAAHRFSAGTYGDTQTTDVAAEAGASPALIYHYFGSKAGLHAETVRAVLDHLTERWTATEQAPPPTARGRARTLLVEYLDLAARTPLVVAAGDEPAATAEVRRRMRAQQIELLRTHLSLTQNYARHDIAVRAWFGFVDAAMRDWVAGGCPGDRRQMIIETCLGALEGGLGDWGG